MKNHNFLILLITGILFSGCYTYNVPSGATTPLITDKKEIKTSVFGNFNEAGGNFTVPLTNNVLFSASGNFISAENDYKQDYDSMFYKKTPNNFEVAFGYYGSKKKFANNIMFGIGTGNTVYHFQKDYSDKSYFQAEFVQYFLQYTAGFKYQKEKKHRKIFKEQGISLRYAYHNYHINSYSNMIKVKEIWDEKYEYYRDSVYTVTEKVSENNEFNSFSIYYFFRTGNDKIQFEISPGLSFYNPKPEYETSYFMIPSIHFNLGMVLNLNHLLNH